MMPSEDDILSTRAFKEEHMKMMRDMNMTYSGNPNLDFARGMIPHHRGARSTRRVFNSSTARTPDSFLSVGSSPSYFLFQLK